MRALGIDPGISGAWCVVEGRDILGCGDMPTVGTGTKAMVSPSLFLAVLDRFKPDCAIVEVVGSMPKQGVSSSFRFGKSAGLIEGVLAARGVSLRFVAPLVWKRHFGLVGADKEGSRAKAIERWPNDALIHFSRKRDNGRAEAALIAQWGIHAARLAGEIAA